MKKISLSLLLLLSISLVKAQTYGNEWINHSQDYYKIKIGKNGIFRLTYTDLSNAGIPVSTINPKGIQIFYRGQEQALFVSGDADNSFDLGDYIEFYAVKNDGTLDAGLYKDAADQPHKHISFFSDSSVYMLTWNNANSGLRMSNYFNPNYTGLKDSFINFTSRLTFEEEWYDGVTNLDVSDQCESTKGEGYMSNRITSSGRTFFINSPDYSEQGIDPILRVLVYGRSNPDIYVGGKNHILELKIRTNDRILDVVKDNGYYEQDNFYPVKANEIVGDRVALTTTSTASNFDYSAISLLELNYTRHLDLNGSKSFTFSHDGNTILPFANVNNSSKNIYLYDIKRQHKIRGSIINDSVFFNLEYKSVAEQSDFYLCDSAEFNTLSNPIEKVQFLNISPADYTYLIVTHSKLLGAAKNYEDYRKSPEGRSFKTLLVTTDQLYNEFYFGYHHPLALKNFFKYFYQKQSSAPEYALLIGKGNLYNKMKEPGILENADLVPTFGFPPSDNLLTAGLGNNPRALNVDIPIGRIPADQVDEVNDYLSKLKEYELDLNAPYKKEILQIAGGASAAENLSLQNALNNYYEIFRGKEFGGWRTMVSKSDAATVSVEHEAEIQSQINDGVSMLSYFGHGSSNVLDVEIGKPGNLNNSGKYPIFYFNGCVLGNTFSESSLCEDYLFEPNKGAIAWMASTAVGFTNNLDTYSKIFHRIAFKDDYGNSIGNWLKQTMTDYVVPGNLYNERQTTQFTIQGDPAIMLYNAGKADFSLEEERIAVLEDGLDIAENDSLTLLLPAINFGKATDDTMWVNVQIKKSSGEILYVPGKAFTGVTSKKDLLFGINIENIKINGLVNFTILIDSANRVDELGPSGEFNNTFTYDHFLSLTGVTTLFPVHNSIINTTQVTLKAQNTNMFEEGVEYYIELDTTPEFNSPALQQSGLKKGAMIFEEQFNLLPTDSVDYFWRCRLNLPFEEGGEWNRSSFTMIYNSPEGWSEGYYTKFQESNLSSLILDSSLRKLEFARETADPLEIWTSGGNDLARKNGRKFLTHHAYASCDWYNYMGIELLAINPDNEQRYDELNNQFNRKAYSFWCTAPAGFEKYYMADSTTGEYTYDTRTKEVRDSLIAFLNRIPKGYHLMVKNGWIMGIEDWEPEVFDAFEDFGIIGLRNQKEYYPFALFGQKGIGLGEANENYADTSLAEDPTTQGIKAAHLIYTRKKEGSIISNKIGPAKKWKQAYFVVEGQDSKEDAIEYVVWGLNTKDSLVELRRGTDLSYNISNVSVKDYPYLVLEAKMKDDIVRTPFNLKRWTVLYDGIPEGTLSPDIAFDLHNDTINQGDTLRIKIAYKNISKHDMDSVLVQYQLENNTYKYDSLVRMDSVKVDEYLVLSHPFDTRDLTEDVKLKVLVNPNFDQDEQYLENNLFFKKIVVQTDKKKPFIDVLFDGIAIMNNDIINPKPVITLSANDDNEHLLLDNVNLFSLKLRKTNESQFTEIDLEGPEISFTPQVSSDKNAIVEFRPTELESGTYELVAQVTDRSGNQQPNEYSIRFRIVTESAISNVYPYPNPFTTQTRFVFTLTGEIIPDDMSITIMNVRGQIVKEISAAELGPLKIGNNITDFAWNGTDNFGDKLANGVYFYKVNMGSQKGDFEHFETSADALNIFKHDLGKLYIAR